MICISSQPQIRQRAYEIFQERLQTGRKGDALSDWLEAQYQIHGRRVPAHASMPDLSQTCYASVELARLQSTAAANSSASGIDSTAVA